jgi:hypothetical protein
MYAHFSNFLKEIYIANHILLAYNFLKMQASTLLKLMKILVVITILSILSIMFSSFIIMIGFLDVVTTLSTFQFTLPFLFIFLVLLSTASLVIAVINVQSSNDFEVFPEIFEF